MSGAGAMGPCTLGRRCLQPKSCFSLLLACLALAAAARGARALGPAPSGARAGASVEAAQSLSDLPACGADGSLQPATDNCSVTVQFAGAGATKWCAAAVAPREGRLCLLAGAHAGGVVALRRQLRAAKQSTTLAHDSGPRFTFAISQEVSLEMTVTLVARTLSGSIDMWAPRGRVWRQAEPPTGAWRPAACVPLQAA